MTLVTLLLSSLLSGEARALEQQVGATVALDGSTGLITRIPRLGMHGGLAYTVGGAQNAFQLDVQLQSYTAYGLWEQFPALSLSWSHGWGEGELRPYHALGAGVALTGVMETALAPALPMLRLEGGVELQREHLWGRLGLAGFAVVPGPTLGGGPKLTIGAHF